MSTYVDDGWPTDDEARQHMAWCPDHEIIVDTDDQWHCLTCEGEESEQ